MEDLDDFETAKPPPLKKHKASTTKEPSRKESSRKELSDKVLVSSKWSGSNLFSKVHFRHFYIYFIILQSKLYQFIYPINDYYSFNYH